MEDAIAIVIERLFFPTFDDSVLRNWIVFIKEKELG